MLRASTLPPPHRLAAAFLVDLETIPGSLALILDDYHAIQNPDIHAFMQRMVSHLPPAIQLVVITRQDPPLDLPKLRAQRRVLEIDGDDLGFTSDEAKMLLSRVSGKLVDDEIVTLLSKRTEGWPVGLQMAAISLRESRDPSAFARRFVQTRHHLLTEYLLSEVLSELTTAERAAALKIAIADRFSADLCEAVVDQAGGGNFDGEAFIQKLTHAHLFTIALDDEGVWFRYHHLFRDLLRHRLQRTYTDEAIARMHVRASAWFAGRGLLDEAIEHALTAGDGVSAAELVEAHRIELLEMDQWRVLEKWLDRLPDEIKQRRPNLLLSQAWIQLAQFRVPAVASIVQTLATLLDDETNQAIRGEVDLLWGILWYWQEESERSLAFLHSALELLPETY